MPPTRQGRKTGRNRRSGAVLAVMLTLMVMLSAAGFGLLEMSAADGIEAAEAVKQEQAFWAAEAGIQRTLSRLEAGNENDIVGAALGRGQYDVLVFDDVSPPRAVATGTVGGQTRMIEIEYKYLGAIYEDAVWAGSHSVGGNWQLSLRGTGTPDGNDRGGTDEIHGDVYVNGDVALHEESRVYPPPAPNEAGLAGDVHATGTITVDPTAGVSGSQDAGAEASAPPDLLGMGYHTNNTHDIAALFDSYGIISGRLPSGHELYNVVVKNPGSRATECASTPGDDYFFEPATFSSVPRDVSVSAEKDAVTRLDLGDDRVYYVDGHVWFHSHSTYGFALDTRSTIVSTHDIHVSDNLKYQSNDDLLGLVALGQYDAMDNLVAGTGNVFFGDPEFGTLYQASAFMFAAGDFQYNMDSTDPNRYEEPTSGFEVFGNFASLGRITVNRDWYTHEETVTVPGRWEWRGWRRVWVPEHDEIETEARPAWYDGDAGQWLDSVTGDVLTGDEIASLRHYRMIVKYDERIRKQATQPPGLPRSTSRGLYGGLTRWRQLPARAT